MQRTDTAASDNQRSDHGGADNFPFRRVAIAALAALVVSALPTTSFAQDPDSAVMQRGRELTRQFYDSDMDPVAAAFTEDVRTRLGGTAGLRTFHEQVMAQLGGEVEVVNERVTTSGVHRVYHRSARFEKAGPTVVAVVWSLDADGRVAGFFIRPEESQQPAESRFLDYATRTPLRLPFEYEMTVGWGGRSIEQNYHAAYHDQRFAYDLLIVQDGRTHRGDGRTNEDYFCFGRPLVAPGAGVVVVANDGIPDNTPGELESSTPPGNHVVIDHGDDEYSLLAHFRQTTIRVAVGDRVAAGDTLGECGNSGRSSEPHLHYHLQNAPAFGRGEGLPAQFLNYLADDSLVARGEPVRGQRIRPAR